MEGNNSIRFLQIQIGIWRTVPPTATPHPFPRGEGGPAMPGRKRNGVHCKPVGSLRQMRKCKISARIPHHLRAKSRLRRLRSARRCGGSARFDTSDRYRFTYRRADGILHYGMIATYPLSILPGWGMPQPYRGYAAKSQFSILLHFYRISYTIIQSI